MWAHNDRLAVSTIIGALLLIAIAVAAAILLYVFAMGMMSSASSNGGLSIFNDQVKLESYNWQSGTALVLTLRNIGTTTLNLATADYYVNGVMMPSATLVCSAGAMASQFTPKGVCTVTLTVSLVVTQGQSYSVRVAFADGGMWEGSVTYGDAA